jgi:hypothetical protein
MPFAATTTGTAAPFVKFAEIGDTFIGAYGGGTNRQQRDYKTGDPKFKDDGIKPMLEELMFFVAMPGTTAVVGNLERGETSPIAEGEIVRYAVSGFKWGQVIQARKDLPPAFGFKSGQTCSSDVYTFTVSGFSAATDNAGAAKQAGFTVVEGRIVMTTPDDHERWVLHQVKKGGNANAAKDFTVSIRRADEVAEKAYMQQADELFQSKPWEQGAEAPTGPGPFSPAPAAAPGGAGGSTYEPLGDEEPFVRDAVVGDL